MCKRDYVCDILIPSYFDIQFNNNKKTKQLRTSYEFI